MKNGFKKVLQGMLIGLGLVSVMACIPPEAPPMTQAQEAADQEATEQRAKEMLSETSPRNMNEQPKAVPEFRTRVPGIRQMCR